MLDISEATAPVKVVKVMLEADLQDQCVRWYKALKGGMSDRWARKFSSISQRSVPDYLFSSWSLTGPKIKFACEFKRPGCKINKDTGCMSTQAQVDEQELMRLAGWFVFECDNFDKFKKIVLAYESEQT
jgi:hypothetical protein